MNTTPRQHQQPPAQYHRAPRGAGLRKAIVPACIAGMGLALMAFGPKILADSTTGNTPPPAIQIQVSPVVPTDIFTNGDSAANATLTQAAVFAWQEFIALNWPAQTGYRDSANASATFGASTNNPLVWHTFRHKVEIFPGNSQPPHGYNASAPDYGYNDNFVPKYYYNPASTGTTDGQVMPLSGTSSTTTPWINLDETTEIGVNNMYTGAVDSTNNGNLLLFLAKANKQEYIYAAKQQWYTNNQSLATAKQKTVSYINANSNTPQPNMGDSLVSMPYGTIEIKTAWRKLSTSEQASGRFYTNTVRHYVEKGGEPYYTDEVYGMMALHIIQKTPTAPYFIFATFEQADNILTSDGRPVEDADGAMVNNLPGTSPYYNVVNANGPKAMQFTRVTGDKRLYYINAVATYSNNIPLPDSLQLPQGKIRINQRFNPIPADIIAVNKAAHNAINSYNSSAVWQYYKLINVQYKPINKPTPGVDYHGADSATYYQANSVVESDYILQKFSGRFYSTTFQQQTVFPNFISDFGPAPGYATVHNAYNNGKFLMGGCMGCHGNATNGGTDYSFIFGSPVNAPSPTRQVTTKEANLRFLQLFHPTAVTTSKKPVQKAGKTPTKPKQ